MLVASADFLSLYDVRQSIFDLTTANGSIVVNSDIQRVCLRFATFDMGQGWAVVPDLPENTITPSTDISFGERVSGTLNPIEITVDTYGPLCCKGWFALLPNPVPLNQKPLIITEVFLRRLK